jgi:hypothetical protein
MTQDTFLIMMQNLALNTSVYNFFDISLFILCSITVGHLGDIVTVH